MGWYCDTSHPLRGTASSMTSMGTCMCECQEIDSPVEGNYVTVSCGPVCDASENYVGCEQCCWHKCGSLGPGSNIQM